MQFRSCPRCEGDLHANRDMYGKYEECLQCGYMAYPQEEERQVAKRKDGLLYLVPCIDQDSGGAWPDARITYDREANRNNTQPFKFNCPRCRRIQLRRRMSVRYKVTVDQVLRVVWSCGEGHQLLFIFSDNGTPIGWRDAGKPQLSRYWSLNAAARKIGVSQRRIRQLVDAKVMDPHRSEGASNKYYRFRDADLEAGRSYLKEQGVPVHDDEEEEAAAQAGRA